MGFLTEKVTAIEQTPIKLVCPCGLPLELARVKVASFEGRSEWVLGHFSSNCSPLIHGPSFREVAGVLLLTLLKYGRLPTREEYLKETDPKLLGYVRGELDGYEPIIKEARTAKPPGDHTKRHEIEKVQRPDGEVTTHSSIQMLST